uniref:Uncharacterized protein n=1 Tax=Panagrolaimus superbus TaxID=310955 RepID=A0A914Z6M3_9BILA
MLATDIARLMAQISKEKAIQVSNGLAPKERERVHGGAFDCAAESETPFGLGNAEGFDKGRDESEWIVSRERLKYDEEFDSLNLVDGKVNGRTAKEHMLKSKLPNPVLGKIWKLADVDKDGFLDADEFALANYLINLKLEGHELPNELPKHLVPPGKKDLKSSGGVYPQLED